MTLTEHTKATFKLQAKAAQIRFLLFFVAHIRCMVLDKKLGDHLIITVWPGGSMNVPHFMVIDLSTHFTLKTTNVNLLGALCYSTVRGKSQRISKVSRIHHLGTVNICTKLCASASHRCRHVSLRKRKVDVLVEPEEKPGDNHRLGFILWAP